LNILVIIGMKPNEIQKWTESEISRKEIIIIPYAKASCYL